MIDISTHNLTFGEHFNPGTLKEVHRAEKIAQITSKSWIATVAISSVLAVLAGLVVIPVVATIASILTLALYTTAAYIIGNYFKNKAVQRTIGILNSPDCTIPQIPKPRYDTKCDAAFLESGWEVHQVRLQAIATAEHSVLISGSFCGGRSFNDILDALEKRVRDVPDLKIVILTDDKFISQSNRERMKRLSKLCGGNCEIVEHPQLFYSGKKCLSFSSNHCKAFIVDGKICVSSGSGIQDQYTYRIPHPTFPISESESFIEKHVAKRFLDSGVAFTSEGEGPALNEYRNFLGLAYRWQQLSSHMKDGRAKPSIIETLLGDEITLSSGTRTPLTHFKSSKGDALKIHHNSDMKVYATGPDHTHNAFYNDFLLRIKRAKKRILIGNLYTQFDRKQTEALAEKLRSGVKVTIITNGHKDSITPLSHALFVPRNERCLRKLIKEAGATGAGNLHIYQVVEQDTTFHTKLTVIDDDVYSGSSNMGWKSQEMVDYENNTCITSKSYADEVESHLLEYAKEIYHLPNGPKQNLCSSLISGIYKCALRFFIG